MGSALRSPRRILTVALLALAIASPQEALADGQLAHPVFQKGFTLGGWSRDDYSGPEVRSQIEELRAAGVEWIALTPRWFQATRSSVTIRPHADRSPSDESVVQVAAIAEAHGLRILLKPQVDVLGPGWRGEIAFDSEEDWAEWFRSYQAFVSHYARLAAKVEASMFCVGVELDATRHRTRDWRAIIARMRQEYTGPLVYAANWKRERDIEWWDDLDYAGVDAYFPMASHPDPSPSEIQSRWAREIASLEEWADRIEKPVIFTEIGYRSIAGAGAEPWEWQREGVSSPGEQALLYRAALSALWSEPWFYGFYWWQWRTAPPTDRTTDTGFTPQGKPAWDAIREFYGRESRCPTRDCG